MGDWCIVRTMLEILKFIFFIFIGIVVFSSILEAFLEPPQEREPQS